jgi:ketosteroid isomerase-like protein
MRGKQDFMKMFDFARGKFSFEAQSEFDEISIHGEWAHVATRLAVNMTPRAGGPAQHQAGYTLTILRKNNGQWQVYRDANLLAPEVS